MKVLSVSCNNCGAPLEVPRKTRFLTCKFCESRLEIQKSDSAYFTNVIEAVHEMKDDVETIKMQNSLERLDREWGMERQRWTTTDKHGRSSVPSFAAAIMFMVAGSVAGIVILSTAPGGFGNFGLVFLAFGLLGGTFSLSRAKNYAARRRRYESKRRDLARGLRGR
jgi:uncharacterized Zn finger protein (UPF0148 family)